MLLNILFIIGMFLIGFAIGQLIMIFHQRTVWGRKRVKQHTFSKADRKALQADASYFNQRMKEHASEDFR